MSDAGTIVTGPMRAAEGPHTTSIERLRTLPLTPTPVAPAAPEAPTAPAIPEAPAAPAASPRVRAVSASQNPREALESYEGAPTRASYYDKLVGQTLDGRYFVEKKIGEGGMGVVFAARHAVIERPLAIKVLKREVMRDTATIQRFVQEAKAASRIGHPNIVDVTDFGTTPDGMTYSVMEYVSGRTLGAMLRQEAPFAMTRAIRIAAQIARALGAAHDKGIVHRDLKPENVFLLERDGRPDFVKIVDFGIAKVAPLPGQDPTAPRLTRAGSVFGTPEYMAPEQAAGRGDTDARVDIYALGVILYEMVTGRVPHKGDSMVRTLAMQMLEPITPPSRARPDLSVGPELEGLIMKALAKKREDRFQTMGELRAAIDQLQTLVGTSVTGSPVYALVPLPPGADPSLAAAPTVVPVPVPVTPVPIPVPVTPIPGADASAPVEVPHPITGAGPAAPAERRLKDEPEFVARRRPITFEHVFTEERAASTRRRWPVLLLLALALGGAAGAVAIVLASRGRDRVAADDPRDPGPPAPAADAALLAIGPAADAGAAAAEAAAVALPPPADATAVAAIDPPDAAAPMPARSRDAAVGSSAGAVTAGTPSRGPVDIQVLTKPERATLHDSHGYRGPGGAHLREPFGTKLEVTCKHPGYKDGVVKLVFDGKREAELCVLERVVICIPGVKNPFDQCPD